MRIESAREELAGRAESVDHPLLSNIGRRGDSAAASLFGGIITNLFHFANDSRRRRREEEVTRCSNRNVLVAHIQNLKSEDSNLEFRPLIMLSLS